MGASVLVAFGVLALVVAGVGLFGEASATRSRGGHASGPSAWRSVRTIVGLIDGRSLIVELLV